MKKESPKIQKSKNPKMLMVLGDPGKNGLNVPSLVVLVEEPKTESGAVTLQLQQMVEKSVKGDILATGLAIANHVIKKILKIMIFNN